MAKTKAPDKRYVQVISPLFPEAGILLEKHISGSGNDACVCLFENECVRTMLADYLLICSSLMRPANKIEKKTIRRLALHKSLATDTRWKREGENPDPDIVSNMDDAEDLEVLELEAV